MTFQIMNRQHPNSRQNTVVFCVFNAKDSRENLQLATARYSGEIMELQGSKWRGEDGKEYAVRVFATGDYALLCLWYGLSGANGCHPCLWCDITKEEMADPDERRLQIPARTLDTLQHHHSRFTDHDEGKGNTKVAKLYHNAIAPAMFRVPIDQVMIPGPHISLGLYLKLFKLLEADLPDLDLKLQSYLASVLSEVDVTMDVLHVQADANLGKFDIRAIDEARTLDNQADALHDELDEQEDQLAWLAFCGTDEEHAEVIFSEACKMVEELVQRVETLRSKAEELRAQARVKIGQGPLTSQLDPLLQRFRVKRQAFHSQSFIGNHVQRMLQEDAINELTDMVKVTLNTMLESYPDLPLSLARKTASKYKELFDLFAKCHHGYSHTGPMEETAISELDKGIKEFLQFYRNNVPNGTIPVKMHMLEDHVVPCIRQWGFGLGFLGEQGVEHVHALFNVLARPTCTIPDPVARLKSTLTNHLIGVSPQNVLNL
ncbi:uncharacterized protein LOC144916318 [Branchiostoma floridae x Branchiostoma belcheri]